MPEKILDQICASFAKLFSLFDIPVILTASSEGIYFTITSIRYFQRINNGHLLMWAFSVYSR